jgi:hypothetical protein
MGIVASSHSQMLESTLRLLVCRLFLDLDLLDLRNRTKVA